MFSKSTILLLWNVNVGVHTRHEKHLFFKLDTENAENHASVQLLLNSTLTINGYQNTEYHCRGKLDDTPDPSDAGCRRAGRCREYTVMSVPGDVLIITLQMFRHDEYCQPYKKNPKIDINEELMAHDRFELCCTVWHEGPSTNSGHYTSNLKVDRRWFYTNDTTVTEGLKKYIPRSMVVPNILVYKKKNNMLVPVSSDSITCSNSTGSKLNPELMNKYNVLKELNTQKVFLATATKREANEMNNASDKIRSKKDLKNNVKDKKKVEKENDNGVKYNFVKRKSNFTNKSSRERFA